MKNAIKSMGNMKSIIKRRTLDFHYNNKNTTIAMEEKKNKITALIGDYLKDKETMIYINSTMSKFGKKCLFYKDINAKCEVISVIIIFNSKCTFEFEDDDFLNYTIYHKVPITAIYTDINNNSEIHENNNLSRKITSLWESLPSFQNKRFIVPTIHITRNELDQVVRSNDFQVGTNLEPCDYYILKN